MTFCKDLLREITINVKFNDVILTEHINIRTDTMKKKTILNVTLEKEA